VAADADHVHAARDGIGTDAVLLVDAGTVFGADVEVAAARLPALEDARVTWLEEPFTTGSASSYLALSRQCRSVRLAGGEGAHNASMAKQLIDHAGIGFVQIDTGRIGGIGDAHEVAGYAQAHSITFVNHTFTSHLALSASLQPFAGLREHRLCEYPVESKPLAVEATRNHVERDASGQITTPELPGLGLDVDTAALAKYLVDVEITMNGQRLFTTKPLRP
jgi:L-alanine-DL-glutamate epimerase-like enolase superfamily enzyme